MMRAAVILACFMALFGRAAQASDVGFVRTVTPENIASYDDRFQVVVQGSDGFRWFEVTVQRPGNAKGGMLAVGAGRGIFTDANATIRIEPSRRGGEWVFRFGLSDAKTVGSSFLFTEGDTSYRFDLPTFVTVR